MAWFDAVLRDLRMGLRLLRKDAVVSAASIVSLALAIGACTAAFSLIDALILRPLPVPEPNRLVYVSRISNNKDLRLTALFSYPLFDRLRQTLPPHLDVFSMSHQSLLQAVLPDSGGVEEKLRTQFVSGNAFNVLGVTAAIGRVLQPSDDVAPGAHAVAVVSHAFWTRRLGGDAAAVGSWIQVQQRRYEIVGVTQSGFTGTQPGTLTDVWVPNMMYRTEALTEPQQNWLQIWGRLGRGETARTAQPIVLTLFANFESDRPGDKALSQPAVEPPIQVNEAPTGLSQVRSEFARPLFALAAIVSLVLLIACSNVANLLLARGAARGREMALRVSIGAGRARLVQQVLIESGVLTAVATALGVLAAMAAVPLIVGMLATNENPVYLATAIDWRMLMFAAALGGLATVVFGLAPALRASAAAPAEATGAGNNRHTPRAGTARSLIAVQIAFSLMILFVAGLLLRSFDRLLAVDLGFKPEHVVLVTVEARDHLESSQAREVGRQLLERVRGLPGVDSASMSGWALFRGFSSGSVVDVPGGGRARSFRLAVSPQFFQTMGTRIVEGREFQPGDSETMNPMPVIVNDVFARTYLSGGSALGRRLTTTRRGQPVLYEIVGVAAGVRDGSVRGEMSPFLFSPIGDADGTLQIRSTIDPRTLADRIRVELPQVHPSLKLVDVTLQTSLVRNTLLRERLLAVLSGFFAALGLVLAAVGLYGVLSYSVARRTREIGIRLTLGAQPAAVVRAVLGRVMLALAVGILAGLAGGVYFARFVRTLLFEIEPVSLSSLCLPVLVLSGVALVASWPPARRATRVDPAEALRMD